LFSDNYIGALGASTLANAIAKNSTLEELELKGNELGNEGVKAICGAFRSRKGGSVKALDLGNNR
jgi:NLR family CARD domain-containing protein 3